MTPFSFEWHWNPDYFVFMGLLYLALMVIACGLVYCLIKTWMGLSLPKKPDTTDEGLSYRSRYPDY
jgi:hypothetical protein